MRKFTPLAIAFLFLTANIAVAQCLVPNPIPNGTTTGAQTMTNCTGTVDSGGAISTSGGTVALVMTGTSTLVNNGTIEQTGAARAVNSNSAGSNLTVTNTGLISSVSAGAQAIDWAGAFANSSRQTG